MDCTFLPSCMQMPWPKVLYVPLLKVTTPQLLLARRHLMGLVVSRVESIEVNSLSGKLRESAVTSVVGAAVTKRPTETASMETKKRILLDGGGAISICFGEVGGVKIVTVG